MQNSSCEIKDKLLRALDKEYNVVDMATVLEVISLLEKATITRETLEKTRIGKYINELRKKTSNEQLARRAKELVKSWRKLLPQTESTINGERVIKSNIAIPILGPGPGPGFGPGPGPGKFSKTTSPSISCELSASPLCSSASNSPQFSFVKHQVSNRPLTPSYAPTKSSQLGYLRSDKEPNFSSHIFKPVSPALAAARFANSGPSTEIIPQPKPQNLCISPAHLNNSLSCSPHSDTSAMNTQLDSPRCRIKYEATSSPCHLTSKTGSDHSTLETAKTNVANKRLRKSPSYIKTKKKKSVLNNSLDTGLQNGLDSAQTMERLLLPSESSAFKTLTQPKCTRNFNTRKNNQRNLKSKKASDMQASELLKEKFSSLNSGSKLPKVKTTQQLIEEFQAKKDALNNPLAKSQELEHETDISWTKSPSYVAQNAELLRSKTELMKKFLSFSPESPSVSSCHESPVVSSLSDNDVPSKSSVITPEKDSAIPYTDPVSAEIEKILSALAPINPEEINLNDEEEPLPERKSPSRDDVECLLSKPWEFVNGNYSIFLGVGDSSGSSSWKQWNECTEVEIAPGEIMKILPYVNID